MELNLSDFYLRIPMDIRKIINGYRYNRGKININSRELYDTHHIYYCIGQYKINKFVFGSIYGPSIYICIRDEDEGTTISCEIDIYNFNMINDIKVSNVSIDALNNLIDTITIFKDVIKNEKMYLDSVCSW